ncbi:MAG: hypothetical protein J5680_01845 [Neisseriaceae bacterium]|nr:hypothetical protein [Neisseriaceae bacterium]MBR5674817.1 hypothetical protein [Neisseriaceae bacterium]
MTQVFFFRQPKTLYTQALRLVWWVENPPYNKTLRFGGGSKTHPTNAWATSCPPYNKTCGFAVG